MKKVLSVMIVCAVLCAQMEAQSLRGRVMDENDVPMEYATVALMAMPDSTITGGGMTDAEGMFELPAPEGEALVQVSMIGYGTVELPASAFAELRTVKLFPDTEMLAGATVSAQLPRTELKGDAVVTNIAGSVLEHSGNALDVLGKVPGMISRGGNLEVLGRGEPIYYINGRKVTDNSELRNLMSEDIKSIDVVSNPGAIYGGNVRCVVRIKTVKHQGEGFGFALTSQAKQHVITCQDFEPSWSVLDLNYRVKGWDFFGKAVYWDNRGYQISTIDGGSFIADGDKVHSNMEKGNLDYRSHYGGFQFIGGANWQINENHSLGFKIDRGFNIFGGDRLLMDADLVIDNIVLDHVTAVNESTSPESDQWAGNLYYDGNVGKLNINFNADFLTGGDISNKNVHETSWTTPAEITSNTDSRTAMGAGKLILSHPVWKGTLRFGSEETYVSASQTYAITFAEIPSSDASLTENTIAGFAEYAVTLPFGQASAGLRYEHTNFGYHDHIDASNSLDRTDDNWFPSFSFATRLGEVGISLSYTGKTVRPAYHMLSNEITYDNRYCYQSGDPTLRNEKCRTAAVNANWNWLTFSGVYERVDNYFVQWASPYSDPGVLMIKYANLDSPLHKASFYLNASPTIGVWNPRYTVGIQKQSLKMDVADPRADSGRRIICLNHPMYFIQAENAFRFKHSWLLEANYNYYSRMSVNIAEVRRPMQDFTLSVQKSFLKDDALTFRLSWCDIFNSSIEDAFIDFGGCEVKQTNDRMRPCIQFLVSYRFNSAQSKYKGTGAGQEAKSRIK